MEEERIRGPWEEVRKAPLLRVGVGFVLGIVLARSIALDAALVLPLWTLATIVTCVGLLPQRIRWARGLVLWRHRVVLLLCWSLVTGMARQSLDRSASDPRHFSHDVRRDGVWLMEVLHLNGASERVLRADAAVVARSADGEWMERTGTVMLTLMRREGEAVLRAGDVVVVDGSVEDIVRFADPGGFDRVGWASSKGIRHELFVVPDDWRPVAHNERWTDLFSTARERVGEWLKASRLDDTERALVKALVLGQRDELDPAINQAFVRSGTVHVLAVSGMHVGLIYVLLGRLLAVLGQARSAQLLRSAILLASLWAYAGLTGGSPSVLRATAMFSLFVIAESLGRRQSSLNSLVAAAILLLAWEPAMLHQASFQLSFLAVLGILLFMHPIQSLWQPTSWLLRQVWSLVTVSIAAQVFTTPVSLLLFKAFPLWFLPANVLVVTAMSFAIHVAIAFVVFHWVPLLSAFLVLVLSWLLRIATYAATFIADLPFAYPAVRIDVATALLLHALTLSVAAWLVWRWRSARTVSLVLLAACFLSWAFAARKAQAQMQLVIYDDRDRLFLGLVQGRNLLTFGPSGGEDVLRNKAERHARHDGLRNIRMLPMDSLHDTRTSCQGAWCWAAGGIAGPVGTIRFLSGRLDASSSLGAAADVLVFHDLTVLDTTVLRPLVKETGQVVLGGGLRWRHRSELRRWVATHGMELHEVRVHGAFLR